MIVRHWTQPEPRVVASDTMVVRRPADPEPRHAAGAAGGRRGRLRGLAGRAPTYCGWTIRHQHAERRRMAFFSTRVRVRDGWCATRPRCRPTTRLVSDCLEKGARSAWRSSGARRRARRRRDLGQRDLRAGCIAWAPGSGATAGTPCFVLGPGVLGRIADVAEGSGAVASVHPIGPHPIEIDAAAHAERKVVRVSRAQRRRGCRRARKPRASGCSRRATRRRIRRWR